MPISRKFFASVCAGLILLFALNIAVSGMGGRENKAADENAKPGKYPDRANLSFSMEQDVQNALKQLQELTDAGDWAKAIPAADKLMKNKDVPFTIIEIDKEYALPATKLLFDILKEWPAEARQKLIEKREPAAKELAERATSQKDWEAIAESYPFCETGLIAHLRVAEILFELSRWQDAHYWLARATELNNPDPKKHPQFFAMLAVCEASAGDAETAEKTLAMLNKLGDITIETEGKKCNLPELVKKTRAMMEFAAKAQGNAGENNAGDGKVLIPTKLIAEIDTPSYYYIPDTRNTYEQTSERLSIEQRAEIKDDTLYYSNAKSLRAYDLKNKKQLWLYGLEEDPKVPEKPGSFVYVRSRMPEGTPDSLELGGNRLVNLGRGYQIGISSAGGHMRDDAAAAPKNMKTNTLVSLVGPDGKTVWEANGANEDDTDFLKTMVFLNVPCVSSGKLIFTAVSTTTSPTLFLICIDEKTGTMLWKRYICAYTGDIMLVPEPRFQQDLQAIINQKRLGSQKGGPTMGDDPAPITDGTNVFVSSRTGHISAFDLQTGKPRWTYKYVFKREPTNYSYRNNNLGWTINRPVLWNNLVIAAPTNADELIALDKLTGKVVWSIPRKSHNQLLGVYNNNVIISGKKVTAVNAADGKESWSVNLKKPPFGHGILINGAIYHPNETELTILNAKNGNIIVAQKWDGDKWEKAGNVVITGGKVVICGYNKIMVYDTISTDIDNPKIPMIEKN